MAGSRKGNGMHYGRSVVIWGSLVLTIVALVLYVVTVVAHEANPVWNRALLTYCGVFWVFFAFDEFGRRSVILSEEKRAAAPAGRPRPQPNPSMPLPNADGVYMEQSLAHARAGSGVSAGADRGSAGTTGLDPVSPEVGLQRIQREMLPEAQAMVNDCLTELLALSGAVPQFGPSGCVSGFDAQAWLQEERVFPFLITSGDMVAGVTVLRQREASYELILLYVKQGQRRERIGKRAFLKLEEFSRLLGGREAITAKVSEMNMRGQRFYQSVGMTRTDHQGRPTAVDGSPEYEVEFRKEILYS